MRLTKAEASALGYVTSSGTSKELADAIDAAYFVWEDAPMPHWQREKPMKVLVGLATKIDHKIPGVM
jgi:hypothetical protein